MRVLSQIFLAALCFLPSGGRAEGWLNWFSSDLRELERASAERIKRLDALGTPTTGQTAPQIGYLHPRLSAPSLSPAWMQVDLQQSRPITAVVLIAAQVDWQSRDGPGYGFPPRFRVDLSDDPEFKEFSPIAAFTEEDFPNPGIAPVTFAAAGRSARYVRVTVTKMAQENGQYFYALAELMVLGGNLNLAIDRPVSASATANVSPRWGLGNLVDGRTPLGPPIQRELLEWDGVYAGLGPGGSAPEMTVDLGQVYAVQQVRLHPVHARIGADMPGYSFPLGLRIEVSRTPNFASTVVLLDAQDFPAPGNNPVTLRGEDTEARYVRVTAIEIEPTRRRFGLSEVEIYAGGRNVARGAAVSTSPEPSTAHWPKSALVDGFTSYGRLQELPEWTQGWEERRRLQAEVAKLNRQRAALVAQAERRAAGCALGGVAASLATLAGFVVVTRRRRRREFRDLRLRLARDLHDEIGSNLAGIGVLSEVARGESARGSTQEENWSEINRIAQETVTAMREVLWLIGAREEGADLMVHLRLAASRMLAGKEVVWKSSVNELVADWPIEAKRELFLFFKEALTNVVRHSRAMRVDLSVQVTPTELRLEIFDHGSGFDPATVRRGLGLISQEKRARALGGTLDLDSAPGRGTRVCLTAPLTRKRSFSLGGKKSRTLTAG